MATEQIDQEKAMAFAGRVMDIVNGGSLALMISIGHQTELLDRMAEIGAATSERIAGASGLNERYVREWLGAMVTGRIVEYDPATRTYRLPPEHASVLTRAAGVGNMANFAQMIPLNASVEPQIVECFRNGGGVPYDAFPRFQKLMAELSAATNDATLLDVVLPLVPGIVDRLRAGIDAADIGCGSGHALNLMAQAFPNSRFTGWDISDEGLAAGREEANRLGLTNVKFERKDAAQIDGAAQFDFITVFDAVHDQAQPARMLAGIAKALRPGGVFLCVDIAASSHLHENLDAPLAPFMYAISTMHCMTVSLAYGGAGLGNMWGEQKAIEMLGEAGFANVDVKRVEGDILNNFYIATK